MTVTPSGLFRRLRHRLRTEADRYGGDTPRPLGSYTAAMAAYTVAAGTVVVGARTLGRRPPHLAATDLVALALATNRLTRIVAREPIASPLRAPFTRFTGGTTGPGQLAEEVRGEGPKAVIGELITCPFCLAQWVGSALGATVLFAPRGGLFAVRVLAAIGLADFVQFAWASSDQHTRGPRADPPAIDPPEQLIIVDGVAVAGPA
jgi:hypothetical protein